tara:strand:+ start:201 stop:947 length:747 start_codon:yes stop_codon:yes gene_type:complete
MEKSLNITALVQARMGSSRLYGKVMKKVCGKSLIELLLKRLSKSKLIKKIMVVTPKSNENDVLVKKIKSLGYETFRGKEKDVLDRFYQAIKKAKPEIIIRITGDCPLIDYKIVDKMIKLFKSKNYDYLSNNDPPTYPDGLDVEIFNFKSLNYAWKYSTKKYDREHVTPFIKRTKKFKCKNIKHSKDYSDERITLDELKDFKLIKNIFQYFYPKIYFNWLEIINLKKKQPLWFKVNQNIERNEGSKKLN